MTAVATKVSKAHAARANAKRDHSPKWDNLESLNVEQYASKFREAMKYYNLESSGKELKPKIIDWMALNDYSKEDIAAFKKTKDSRAGLTMGAIASCLLKGMPDVREGFNKDRSAIEWLRTEIANVLQAGANDLEDLADAPKIKQPEQIVTIQDRIRDQAVGMSDELDAAIDSWIMNPEAFDPKEFKVVNLLRGKGAKAAQARYIKSFFQKGYDELLELASGQADEQLREGYKHNSRKNVTKLIQFYESIATACEQIAAEAKVLKKVRAKKIKPAEDLVKKLKFRVSDDKMAITSVPPAQMIRAQGVVVYNTKNRKIGYYVSTTSEGFGVKGTSLTNFTAKSLQKTLRKPAEQLKEFKEQNTQKRFETWFTKSVKTTETELNGRFNEDIVILKVFK